MRPALPPRSWIVTLEMHDGRRVRLQDPVIGWEIEDTWERAKEWYPITESEVREVCFQENPLVRHLAVNPPPDPQLVIRSDMQLQAFREDLRRRTQEQEASGRIRFRVVDGGKKKKGRRPPPTLSCRH